MKNLNTRTTFESYPNQLCRLGPSKTYGQPSRVYCLSEVSLVNKLVQPSHVRPKPERRALRTASLNRR